MDEGTLQALLQKGAQHKASDLLLKVGQPPAFRVDGQLHYLQGDKLRPEQTEALAEVLVSKSGLKRSLEELSEFDTSYSVAGIGRYRVNVYRQRGTFALALRAIPLRIPTFDELMLPASVQRMADLKRGLVLICGAAGNGKSTTLASIAGHINRTRRCHIVTIEDPIEYMHIDQFAAISQREIGLDTPNFATALRAALRQDPDVVLLGEIRDGETMDIALKAAETGHLVLSTIHTPDVQRTVGRILSLAGSDAAEVRERLGDNLRGVVAQRLLPRADKQGRVPACEVLVVTGTARESIRRPESNLPLKEVMDRGAHPYGMQTFDTGVQNLVKQGLVTAEVAKAAVG
jgi:twitching motility protein PilT